MSISRSSPSCRSSRVINCRNRPFTSNARRRIARHQAFRLRLPGVRTLLQLAMLARIKHAKVESLLVLHRRGPIGIKEVPFVKHGVGDLFHHVHVHARAISDCARMASMASSQVGIPCVTL